MVYILLFPDLFVSAWYNKLHPTDRTIKNHLLRTKIVLFLLQDDVPLFVRFGVQICCKFFNSGVFDIIISILYG